MKTFYEILNIFSKSVKIFAFTFVVCGTMLMFVSCGETPNDEPEQYCEGVQNENHDHCKEPGCVLDEHTGDHDYCKENDCDGSNHMDKTHPTIDQCGYCEDGDNTCVDGSECYAGGKVISLGENYQVFDAMNGTRFDTDTDQSTIDSLNTYKTRYEKYVNGLINSFSDEFKTKYKIDNINFRTFEYSTNNGNLVDPQYAIFDREIEQLNDVCAPAIEEITKNICISGNDEYYKELDKTMFKLYFEAIDEVVYNYANSGTNTYTEKKENIQYRIDYLNNVAGTDYNIYQEDGTIHPEALQRFDQMITKAADRLNINVNELRKFVNLSFMPTTLKGKHDCIETKIDHTYYKDGTNTACPTSEMVNTIENDVKVGDMVAQTKLNKSIFNQNYGRELC